MDKIVKKKILIIEDDKIVRENIKALLSEEGYLVYSAAGGEEGIVIANKEEPDLILCDIMMHGINGYEVLKKLSENPSTRTIPFIFLTAKVEKEDIRKGMNLGADDYLFKPFDADDLLGAISSRFSRLEILKEETDSSIKNVGSEPYSADDKLFIQVNKKPVIINISDIIFISAERQYSSLTTTGNKSYLVRKSISHWQSILPEKKFLRIHRSTIINIDYVEKIEPWFNSSYKLYLKTISDPLAISRRYSTKLREKLLK